VDRSSIRNPRNSDPRPARSGETLIFAIQNIFALGSRQPGLPQRIMKRQRPSSGSMKSLGQVPIVSIRTIALLAPQRSFTKDFNATASSFVAAISFILAPRSSLLRRRSSTEKLTHANNRCLVSTRDVACNCYRFRIGYFVLRLSPKSFRFQIAATVRPGNVIMRPPARLCTPSIWRRRSSRGGDAVKSP